MKRFRYRKITPNDVGIMRLMRSNNFTYDQIARVFEVSRPTVIYHLNSGRKRKVLDRARIFHSSPTTPAYIRDYVKERYQNDPEFRERMKKSLRLSSKKRYNKMMKKYHSDRKFAEKMRAYWRGEISFSNVKEAYILSQKSPSKSDNRKA